MNTYNESNVIISHTKFELILIFYYHKNKNLNEIKKLCFDNRINSNVDSEVDLGKLIDLPKFQEVFKSNITTSKIWDRALDETSEFISAIKDYYNIDLTTLNEIELLEFLFKYNQDFNSAYDLIKLNCFNLGARGLAIKISSF